MIRIALPTGDMRRPVAQALAGTPLDSPDYAAGSRVYRLGLPDRGDVTIRVFRERDIPIQVALGNYQLGVCGGVWVEELRARYPAEDLSPLFPLAVGRGRLAALAAPEQAAQLGPLEEWQRFSGLRVVSEFGNLAEKIVAHLRLRRPRVYAVYGGAHAYPPEDADIALVHLGEDQQSPDGLVEMASFHESGLWVVANRRALAGLDLGEALASLRPAAAAVEGGLRLPTVAQSLGGPPLALERPERPAGVRLALPDGHQQPHALASVRDAGIELDGYGDADVQLRPRIAVDGVTVKVVRPQDMPQLVALGQFDMAITGRDWLADFLACFPDAPVEMAVDLGRSRYHIAAVVDEDLPATTVDEALACWHARGRRMIRVASEYPNLADRYARQRRLGRYQVVPIAGASEGFVPEDAEILIEGSETGKTIVANRLRVLERVFESTNCVVIHRGRRDDPVLQGLLERFRRGVPATTAVT